MFWQSDYDSYAHAAAFAPPLAADDDFVDRPVPDIVFALVSMPAEPIDFAVVDFASADIFASLAPEFFAPEFFAVAAFASLAFLSLNPRSRPSSPVDCLMSAPCLPW